MIMKQMPCFGVYVLFLTLGGKSAGKKKISWTLIQFLEGPPNNSNQIKIDIHFPN